MRKALGDRGRHAIEARETLVNLFKIEGRYREAERLVRDGVRPVSRQDRPAQGTGPARLDQPPQARPGAETAWTRRASAAPDDDRVWLGRANLATRTGRDRGGGGMARPLPAAARRSGGLARPARPGHGDGRRGRVAGRPAPPAGRGGRARRGARAPRLVRGSPPATPIEKSGPCGGCWNDRPDHLGPGATRRAGVPGRAAPRNPPGSAAARRSWTGPRPSTRSLLFRPDAASRPAPIATSRRAPWAVGWRPGSSGRWPSGSDRATPRRPRPSPGSERRPPARSCDRLRDPAAPCSPIWTRASPIAAARARWSTGGRPRPSATTPRPPGSGSSSTTGPNRPATSPRR